MFSAHAHLEAGDYFRFMMYHKYRVRWLSSVLMIAVGSLIVGVGAVDLYEGYTGLGMLLIAMGLIYLFVRPAYYWVLSRKIEKYDAQRKSQDVEYRFEDDKVTAKRSVGDVSVLYKDVSRLETTRWTAYLYLNKTQALIVPAASVDGQQAEALFGFLREKIGKGKE